MEEVFTVKEFASRMKLNETYVRHCCAGYINPETGRQYKLPDGWEARRIGPRNRRSWQIFRAQEGFDPLRVHIVAEMLRASLEDKSIDINQLAAGLLSAIPKFLRNSELAELIADRWRYERPLETVEDFGYWQGALFSGGPGMIGVHVPPLQDATALLERLGSVFRAVANNGRKIPLSLDYIPAYRNGKVSHIQVQINARDVKHDAELKHFLEDTSKNRDKNTLTNLFKEIWIIQLWRRLQAAKDGTTLSQRYIDEILTLEEFQSHPLIDDLRKRCLHCGRYHMKSRKDAHFCNPTEKAAHAEWMKELCDKSHGERTRSIAVKLSKIMPALVQGGVAE